MIWELSWRADPFARDIADRHYSRQTIGATGFVPPGRCVVLTANTETGKAYWVTSWPYPEYVLHEWAGAWICSAFRNEGAGLSSAMIREAVAATRQIFGAPPSLGMVTFVDPNKTKAKADPGHCFIIAGFRPCGATKGGLPALMMKPDKMPQPCPPRGFQMGLGYAA